ncbi:MAG: nitrate reductase cytochrome c-type subunit [Candidatus Thioglobus sp.]|nr:nitrate reductase cytochrome c-type subunit [Candidatus Thioglobus pontius]MBL6984272.1 nitrate reductase cytochrome c-type subunit [Candidatus Thioglobus sp.]
MKNKLLAITVASVFTLGSQAGFFDSKHNWNNPISAAMDTVNEVSTKAKTIVTDTVDAVKDVAEEVVGSVTDAANSAVDTVDVASLRGTHVLDDLSIAPQKIKWIKKNVEFERSYDDQPPLIPHKTAGMTINLKKNKCLSCHSDENYKEEESPKMSSTHFFTRDDKRLPEMSPRRYFCLQCHVPQAKLDPLVESDFINLDE